MKNIGFLSSFILVFFQSYSQNPEEIRSIACDTSGYDIFLPNYDTPPVYEGGFVNLMEEINWSIDIWNGFNGDVSVDVHVNCEGEDLYSHIWLDSRLRKRKKRDSIYYSNIQDVLNNHTWGDWKPARKNFFPTDSRFELLIKFKKGKVVDIRDYYADTTLIDRTRGIGELIPDYDSISVQLHNLVIRDSTMSTMNWLGDTTLAERVLSYNDGIKFTDLLSKQSAFTNRPQQVHSNYNVEFGFYSNDSIVAIIRFSSITRTLFFIKNETFISNFCSTELNRYILKLLSRYKLKELIEASELITIEVWKKTGVYESFDDFIVR